MAMNLSAAFRDSHLLLVQPAFVLVALEPKLLYLLVHLHYCRFHDGFVPACALVRYATVNETKPQIQKNSQVDLHVMVLSIAFGFSQSLPLLAGQRVVAHTTRLQQSIAFALKLHASLLQLINEAGGVIIHRSQD